MKLPFLSRRVRFFGNVAIMILCAIFFLVPFAFRGARMSMRSMRNDVADWLPSDFPETKELEWFRDHFYGSQFILISWPGCSEDDEHFRDLVESLRAESLETQHAGEVRIAHELGDLHGLHTTGDYYEDWGSHDEKWLMGHNDEWYYITKDGKLYRWTGKSNLIGWTKRFIERTQHGRNLARGELVAQFGEDEDNKFYEDPTLLAGRFFEGVMTGPELLEQLAGPNGSLIRGREGDNEGAALDARILANQRLTGVVFGPTPTPGFEWTQEAFLEEIPEAKRDELPEFWRQEFDSYTERLITNEYNGDRAAFLAASQDKHLEYWMRLFDRLRVEPPARQTCIIVTLNSNVAKELARVCGRPVLGKPPGLILRAASDEFETPIDELNIHLGGPPVDNVAIDEEGTITLMRLVSLSVIIGVVLAYISFRSVNVTVMVFFIGSVAAVASMGIVWYLRSMPDAVLMSMPALVYVLGLSGAVHIVNYYREACYENGPRGAAETAVKHGWFPCTLAAFTTSLGLISLYTSNLVPIQKFGLFSSLGTMATVILLFTYLPAALQIWPPGYKKISEKNPPQGSAIHALIGGFWERVCEFIIRRHLLVTATCLVVLVLVGSGIWNIRTSVQLLKLFDDDAKVIQDYKWLEGNLGRLVPMELVVRVDDDSQLKGIPSNDQEQQQAFTQLNFLERVELASRVRSAVEETCGEDGAKIVGHGLSTDVFVLPNEVSQTETPLGRERSITSQQLQTHMQELLQTDTLRIDPETGEELWRISLRLGAFNDVDYGQFVTDLKRVVEPIMTAYRHRIEILETVYAATDGNTKEGRILLIGWPQQPSSDSDSATDQSDQQDSPSVGNRDTNIKVDQTKLFCDTLQDLLLNRGFRFSGRQQNVAALIPEEPRFQDLLKDKERFSELITKYDCVVFIRDHELFDRELIKNQSKHFVDATDHQYEIINSRNELTHKTATQIKQDPDHPEQDKIQISTVYTGVVPIVYKAQRTLLHSLTDSICLAFIMIALVMMILLRDWKHRVSPTNFVNVSGGMVSMLPNVFPVVLIFGAMGHLRVSVDIGSMMTASVAMGIAVDDTIHFMSWFRKGLRDGYSRIDSIRLAYKRVATAMTQTTMIGGLGLSVFALSTFTPTQRFGVLMLTLLFAALLGDLIFLPALLAGPLGKLFMLKSGNKDSERSVPPEESLDEVDPESNGSADVESSGHVPHRHGKQEPKQSTSQSDAST